MQPEEVRRHEYAEITEEVSTFYDRLQFARSSGDADAEIEAEEKMNGSLDELCDLVRAIGRTAL